MSTHGPIEEKHRAMMNTLAAGLDGILNPEGEPKTIAFVLLLAEFGDIKDGRVNYISNGERDDMVKMLEELLSRFKGTHPEEKATT